MHAASMDLRSLPFMWGKRMGNQPQSMDLSGLDSSHISMFDKALVNTVSFPELCMKESTL